MCERTPSKNGDVVSALLFVFTVNVETYCHVLQPRVRMSIVPPGVDGFMTPTKFGAATEAMNRFQPPLGNVYAGYARALPEDAAKLAGVWRSFSAHIVVPLRTSRL